jgi:predicted RNA-binding protein YlqC (UPF0109 family)
LKALVAHIAKGLCSHPESVTIEETESPDGGLALTLRVHQGDLPAIIGRNGRIIRAIRALMAIRAAKCGVKATLSLDSGEG